MNVVGMKRMVKWSIPKRILRIGFADFETTHIGDLEAQGIDCRVVGNEVHIFEEGIDTKRKPQVSVKCGAMVVWDRERDSDIDVTGLDSPEDMILAWGDMDLERVYFHNAKFDSSYLLAWFLSHPGLKKIKAGQYVKCKSQRVWLGHIIKGKQGMVYSIKFKIEGPRSEGKPPWIRTVEVWDSAKIWKNSLEDLGIEFDPDGSLGFRKGGTTGGSKALEVGVSDDLRKYCLQDCKVLAHVMKFYLKIVEDYTGNPNGYMTAAATAYNMALIHLHQNFMKSTDDKRVKNWILSLSSAEQEIILGKEKEYYCDQKIQRILPKLDITDLRERVKDATGAWMEDENGKKIYRIYDKISKNGNVIQEGEARYSWMRHGYKGSTPLLDFSKRFEKAGLCENVIIKDVNSMYPTQLITKPLPYGNAIPISTEECCALMDCPDSDFGWIAKMQITMSVKSGHRATYLKKHGKETNEEGALTKALDFVDNIESDDFIVVCEPEWKMILRDYDVYDMRILDAVKFKMKTGLFADFLSYWYDIKSNTKNKSLKSFSKLVINSFYGKFGTSPYVEEHGYICNAGVLKDILIDDRTDETNRFYLPIAIWVTAYARNLLSAGCNALGWEHVIYTDTDSWHITGLSEEEATERLRNIGVGNDAKKLGDAPTEQICDYGAYIRPKGYMHFDKDFNIVRMKGKGWIYDEDGSVIFAGSEEKKDIKMAGANIFDGIEKLEDLQISDGGLYAGRLTAYNVVGGLLLMETKVNVLETCIKQNKKKVIR